MGLKILGEFVAYNMVNSIIEFRYNDGEKVIYFPQNIFNEKEAFKLTKESMYEFVTHNVYCDLLTSKTYKIITNAFYSSGILQDEDDSIESFLTVQTKGMVVDISNIIGKSIYLYCNNYTKERDNYYIAEVTNIFLENDDDLRQLKLFINDQIKIQNPIKVRIHSDFVTF